MKSSFLRSSLGALILSPAAVLATYSSASATTNCVFVTTTKAMKLQAPCTTDETLLIPNGVTLDGQGFKITAIDPPGGNFQGAILRNGGKSANVTNIFLRTNLADFCNTEENKVVGIQFDKAAGTISSVNITMNKAAGASTCSEGVAVKAQSVPFSTKSTYLKVTVKNSTLNNNQLAGVVGVGNVTLRVDTNLIKNTTGAAVAHRGVELSDGVKGYVVNNQVLRNSHAPLNNDPGYGILLNNVAQTTVLTNTVNFNDIGIRQIGGSKVTMKGNIVTSSTLDGILVDDAFGVPATGNTLWANDCEKSGGNGIHLQSINGGTTKNVVKSNLVQRNTGSGLSVEGALNKIQVNTASNNTGLDIADFGTGNLYSRNVCSTSTGKPVDCPAVP